MINFDTLDKGETGCGYKAHWTAGSPQIDFYTFEANGSSYLFVVDGSQIYAIDDEFRRALNQAAERSQSAARSMLIHHGVEFKRVSDVQLEKAATVRALSLAVAERCNLACSYCYASGGSFGGSDRSMPWEVVKNSLRQLFAGSQPGEHVYLAFLGGEPLTNRPVIRRATELAARFARNKQIQVSFSITTNGTLLTEADGDFFEHYGFAVNVSLDGIGTVHDALRRTKAGGETYSRILARLRPLLMRQRRMQISARVTVTPTNLHLRSTLDKFVEFGFHSVGFSPVLSSPTRQGQMENSDFSNLLEQMIDCGREFERRVIAGDRYPFSNLSTALREIHRGSYRAYPCGAGAGYFGVSASGQLFACHRFVGDRAASMGSVERGVDLDRQRTWLSDRIVDRQEPCRTCWARYLCGGGCHYEVIHRGRPACDYVRGWLNYVFRAYVRLIQKRPDFFGT